MNSRYRSRLMKACLDLGQHTVLAAMLVSFGATAILTPSVVTFVEYWEPTAKVALVLGVGWAMLTLGRFVSEVMAITGRRFPWSAWVLSILVGGFVVVGTMVVAVVWATNATALRYCQNQPLAEDVERCQRAFQIP